MKKYGLIVMLCAMVLIAACDNGDSGQTTSKSDPFIGGTNGLLMEFLEGSPPAEVFDEGEFPFDVIVRVENNGEYMVEQEKATVSIQGIDPTEFGSPVMELQPPENLEKRSLDSEGNEIPGGISYVEFQGFNYEQAIQGNTPFTVRADICYEYGTQATSLLCIREDVLTTEEGVCTVTESKESFSSGSPLQVTSFTENPAGRDKIRFSFMLEHKGSGLLSKLDTDCSALPGDKNRVWVSVDISGMNEGLSCKGISGSPTEGYVILQNQKRLITCQLDTNGVNGDFEKAVNVEAKFNYKEHIEQTLLVKHSS